MKAVYKKILCLILSAVMIIGIMPAFEPVSQAALEKITSNDGKWIMYDQQEDNEAWLYRYSGDETDVVIPGEIDGYKITGISSECFTGARAPGIYDADNWENNDRIKSITIPSTVETIEYRAFFHMDSLKEVVFDGHMTGNLKVNNDAFKFCMSLESLKFPKYCNPEFYDFLSGAYVTRLEVPCVNANQTSGSLSYSYDLRTVENLTITGDYTFGVLRSFLCTASLKTVEITGFVTGDNVSYDLCKSNGSALNKPDLIFHNIPSAAVDEGLIELGYHKIFDPDTGITTYTVEGAPDKSYSPVLNDHGNFDPLTVGDFGYVLTYSGNAVITNYWGSGESISFPSEMQGYRVTAIGADGFPIDTGDAVSITIPDTVEYIAKSAFEGNSALQHVDFPGSLKIIEARAFKDCSLKEVILPGVVYAGAGAFENCLPDKIFIPSSLRRIPERMFFEDIGSTSSRLTEVTISEGVRSIGPDAFNYKYKHKNYGNRFTLSLPSTVEQIGARAFYYAGILGDLVLPAGINILSEEAFAYNRLSSVTLPENLEKIEKRALSGNRYTESIIIPAKVFYLEEYALSSLTVPEIIINAVIKNIPAFCFYYLTAEKLVIPEGAEQIGEYAFKNAKTGVLDLPASLNKAQSPLIFDSRIDTLIYRCKKLNSGDYGIIGYRIINESSKIGKLIIKDTVRELGENIFEDAVITGEIVMEPGVEIIGECAFWHLSAEEIIIPDTVKTILAAAFAFSELKYVRIPESVTLLGEAAFYSNKLLERVDYLPSSCVLDMSLGYNYYPF
ncbi:MAG: leucine-rich repeat protein, partial [Clostridia bacterium]|nr:leucine-rich repeat protein [Clostridia bacterium]